MRLRTLYPLVLLTFCIGLQAWGTPPEPEERYADNYDMIFGKGGVGSTCTYMQGNPKRGGTHPCNNYAKQYIATDQGTTTAATIIGYAANDSLMHFFGHGLSISDEADNTIDRGGIVCCGSSTRIVAKKCPAGCSICNPSADKKLSDSQWPKCEIAVWQACNSGRTSQLGHGNLLDECVTKGTAAAAGFTEEIYYDPGNSQGRQRYWAKFLWEGLCWGKRAGYEEGGALDCSPLSIAQALGYAETMFIEKYGSAYGYDSWTMSGDPTITAVPWLARP